MTATEGEDCLPTPVVSSYHKMQIGVLSRPTLLIHYKIYL